MEYNPVVTCFLQADQRILLLQRSERVGTDRGKWSAVSGYLEGSEQPLIRALTEIQEETGLTLEQVDLVRIGEPLRAFDGKNRTVWVIHPFLFRTRTEVVRLDWENVGFKWVKPEEIESYDVVPRLREALGRVLWDLQCEPSSLAQIFGRLRHIEHDRVHGAAFLGRQAVTLLSEVVEASNTVDANVLFSHLLLIALRLRKAQPAMANIWSLTGKVLQLVDQKRSNAPVDEVRSIIQRGAREVLEHAEEDSEEVSRIAVQSLPRDGIVLTHSYSSSVLRTLELGFKGGRKLQVYATESHPGFEGKELAKKLIALGIPVTLIPDTAVASFIAKANVVLVGADSVWKDGSLVHKIGTAEIAKAAKKRNVPFYSACESVKFSVQDFLGERPQIPHSLFDVTSPDLVEGYITEYGSVSPVEVESRLEELQAEVYP